MLKTGLGTGVPNLRRRLKSGAAGSRAALHGFKAALPAALRCRQGSPAPIQGCLGGSPARIQEEPAPWVDPWVPPPTPFGERFSLAHTDGPFRSPVMTNTITARAPFSDNPSPGVPSKAPSPCCGRGRRGQT
eukprot:scaffold120847_cov63-Phaeocystis_antarctica.AAC.1